MTTFPGYRPTFAVSGRGCRGWHLVPLAREGTAAFHGALADDR